MHIESIRNNTNGTVTIVSEGGKYEATIDKTTNLFTYLTKNIVTIDDITIGANLLLWENPHTLQTKDIPKKFNMFGIWTFLYHFFILLSQSFIYFSLT